MDKIEACPFANIDLGRVTQQLVDYIDDDLDLILEAICFEASEIYKGNLENNFEHDACQLDDFKDGIEYINYFTCCFGQIHCNIRNSRLYFGFFPSNIERICLDRPRTTLDIIHRFEKILSGYLHGLAV